MIAVGGCKSFTKRPGDGSQTRQPSTGNANDPFWLNAEPKGTQTPTVNIPSNNATGGVEAIPLNDAPTGVLAGRVVDTFNRAPGSAIIQVQATDGGGGSQPRVETSPQGHFLVRGLTPGRNYRVVAQLSQNGKTLAGEVVARPPDARLLIPMSEDYAPRNILQPEVGNTPPLGGGVAATPPAAELGAPRATFDYLPNTSAETIASSEPTAMPRVNIPPPGLPDVSPTPPIDGVRSTGPVPDCQVNGTRILTLRLADTNGNVWDLAQQRNRLTLIDLWGSWCTPCLRAIPDLVRIQQQYRIAGLEVVGIACEKNSTGQNEAAVRAVQRRLPNINYRLLMAGEPGSDPVRAQFRPTAFPSLILVDADGTILWRGIGGDSIAEVEPIIRRRLGGP